MLQIVQTALELGFQYALVAMALFLSYRILDIADLTVDGSLCTGGAVCIMMMLSGQNVFISIFVATLAGILTGLVTGLFHTLMGIPPILSGILTQLALYSVNLKIMGKANTAINVDKYDLLVSLRYIRGVPFYKNTIFVVAVSILLLVLALMGLIPGTPTVPLLLVGVGLSVAGYLMINRMEQKEAAELMQQSEEEAQAELAAAAPPSESDYYKDVNNVYALLNVEPIEMEFGYSLIPLVDESSGGKMINRIVIFRRQYAQEMGLVIPSIRLRDSSSLNTNQYVVKIKGEEVARGEILVDYYLALEPVNPAKEIDGIDTIEPAYGIPGKWISIDKKEMAEIYGYTVIDPLSVMLTHLSETVRKHAHELLSRQEVVQLVDNVKMNAPQLVEELFPNVISYGVFQKILVNLLREGIPIKDMETIMETIADSAITVKDMDTITENIRTALKRTITRKFCDGGVMRVITLSADLEKSIITSLTKGEQGMYLALSPDMMQNIIQQLGDEIRKFQELSQDPIVLTSQVVRQHFYHLIEQFYPSVYVLSFNEISNNIQIQAVGNIGA